jgi:hypothetical protein
MLTALACAAAYPWVLAIEVVSLRRTSKFSRRLSPCSVRQLLMNYTNFTFIQPFFNLISKHMKIVNQSRSVFQSHCLYGRFVSCTLGFSPCVLKELTGIKSHTLRFNYVNTQCLSSTLSPAPPCLSLHGRSFSVFSQASLLDFRNLRGYLALT